MLCPIGTAPFYGRCKQLVSKIYGLVINVQYYLDVIWNPDGLFTDYAVHIYTQFMELVDLDPDCDVCQKVIDMTKADESESDLILVVTVEFTAKCDYGLALTQLASVRGKMIEVHLNGVPVLALLVRSDEQPITKINQGSSQTIYFYNSKCEPDHALLFEDMLCPRLELNYTDIELFPETKLREKDIFSSFFGRNKTQANVSRVSVCLETYFSAMSFNRAERSDGKMTQLMLLAGLIVFSAGKISCLS